MPSSATTKMAHATINGRGCCKYLFILSFQETLALPGVGCLTRLFLLSCGGAEAFVFCSIHHNFLFTYSGRACNENPRSDWLQAPGYTPWFMNLRKDRS